MMLQYISSFELAGGIIIWTWLCLSKLGTASHCWDLEKLFIGPMCQVSVEVLDLLSLPLVKKAIWYSATYPIIFLFVLFLKSNILGLGHNMSP